MTRWGSLEPYHPRIARAIFEVLSEDCFYPGSYKLTNKKGFIAPLHYWRNHVRDPDRHSLPEPRRFLEALLRKDSFVGAIKSFNASVETDWLSGPDLIKLGTFVYSVCFCLRSVLVIDQGTGCLRVRFVRGVS
jgi:hypothetical protein